VDGTEETGIAGISESHENSVIHGTGEMIAALIKINGVIDGKETGPQIDRRTGMTAGVSLCQNHQERHPLSKQ
jgi:hypothetical protein